MLIQVLVHEIWTFGVLPYEGWNNDRVFKEVL